MESQDRLRVATHRTPFFPILVPTLLAIALLTGAAGSAAAQCSAGGGIVDLDSFSVSTSSGDKPQSKLWKHDGHWFSVMADGSGTWVRRLDGTSWTKELEVSSSSGPRADVVRDGDVTHILLYNGSSSQLASVEYTGNGGYEPWSDRPSNSSIPIGSSGETATLVMDTTDRLWAASDGSSSVQVWYSDPPYSSWSSGITVASGITSDDICAITALSGGKIGVMWSDQNAEQFGFKTHTDGNSPSSWSSDEEPAAEYAQSAGNGMADDHINLALGPDGTLYAAVKTSYDSGGYPKLILLVRDPDGSWDAPYSVTNSGTRPVVVVDVANDRLIYAYTASEGYHDLKYRESDLQDIDFGSDSTLLNGSVNNVTSTKEPVFGDAVFLAAGSSSAASVTFGGVSWTSTPELVGNWQFEESSDPLQDSSDFGNDAWTSGSVSHVPGVSGMALELSGSGCASAPDDATLTMCQDITMCAWIRPTTQDTQYVIQKAIKGSTDGYELSLSSSGTVFVRFNQASSGNSYRVDSASSYPTDGSTWMHIAATYDGSKIRLYVNGVLEDSQSASFTIESNGLPLGIGADSGGSHSVQGALDDVMVCGYAASDAEIAAAATPTSTAAPLAAVATRVVAMPNPFRFRTRFALPAALAREPVRIYNVRGQLVREIVPTGRETAVWDGRDGGGARVAAGTYLYRVGTKAFTAGKVVVLR